MLVFRFMGTVREKSSSPKELLDSLKAASDETRLRILNILSFGAFSVNEIVSILGMGQSRISRHLKILTDAKLLKSQREGSWIYYKLSEPTNSIFATYLAEFLISYKEELPFREMDQKKVSWILKEREDKSSRYFDKIGKQWDRIQSEVLNPQVYRNWILHNLPNRSDLILDLGCGPGGMISDLLSRANKVIGIDTSSKMIEAASASFLKNKKVNFIEASLEDLPISKTSANVVVASMVLHHISNPPLVLFEANRVLKSGGTLILVDIKKHDKEFMRDKYADLWLGFDSSLLNEWLEGAGFTVTESSELSTNSDFVLLTIKANKKKGGLNVRSNSK